MLAAAALASLVIGHSVQGREIRAERVGAADAPVNVLVVGDVHGDEPAGEAIVARCAQRAPDGVAFWLVRTGNPDGRALGTRHNARGVDLNRNFPSRWAPAAARHVLPGPRGGLGARDAGADAAGPARAAAARDLLPPAHGDHRSRTRRRRLLSSATTRAAPGCRCGRCPNYHGTAVGWENRRAGGTAFVVELRAGPAPVRRHADAVLALARRYRGAGGA